MRIRAKVAGVGAGLAVAAVTAGIAGSAVRPTSASNRAAAGVAAARVLGEVPLPPGAVQVGADPGAGGWLKGSAASAPATRNLVDVHRFWTVPGTPHATIRWIEAHRPRGSTLFVSGAAGQSGTTVEWSVSFAFHGLPGRVFPVMLGVAVTAARSGGTAMRADGAAVWLIPRARSERVPSGVHAIEVFSDHWDGRHPVRVATLTSARAIRRLTAFVDSRERGQPGSTSCPMIGPQTRVLDLRFLGRRRSGGVPLARALETACNGLRFWIRGRSQPALIEGASLAHVLRRAGVEITPSGAPRSSAPSGHP